MVNCGGSGGQNIGVALGVRSSKPQSQDHTPLKIDVEAAEASLSTVG